MSTSQRAAVEQILTSHDRITGLEGVAGAGKTTSLAADREAAEHEGYKVFGLAPTSRAAQKLAESGIESGTLQRHLVRGEQPDDEQKRLYILDESSLASTRQNEPLHRLHGADRVLLVGTSGNMRRWKRVRVCMSSSGRITRNLRKLSNSLPAGMFTSGSQSRPAGPRA